VSAIAGKASAHEALLYRVLRCAASVGKFTEGPEKVIAMAELADSLRFTNPYGVVAMVKYNEMQMTARPFGEVLHSVRTGVSALERAHGLSVPKYFERNADDRALFDEFMAFWEPPVNGRLARRRALRPLREDRRPRRRRMLPRPAAAQEP
jgi:hypothetical protein